MTASEANSTSQLTAMNSSQSLGKYENWKKGEEKFNKRYEPLKDSD